VDPNLLWRRLSSLFVRSDRLGSLITNHLYATFILLAFLGLAVVYSLATPPLEAGDESRHYAVVKYMADTGRLPVQTPGEAQIHWSHEGNQPPLYYALAAALTFWIDTGSWDDVFWYNPHTSIGNPLRADNKNITIHPPTELWPWRGHVLAVHLIRFLSIGMAVVTLVSAYAIALALFQSNRGLAAGAMAITAFNPMFIFISSAINNDNAVIMFTTLALWLMIQLAINNEQLSITNYQLPITNISRVQCYQLSKGKGAIWLGGLIGLGALSKLYALGLLPLVGLLFLWLAYQEDRRPTTADRSSSTRTKPPVGTDYAIRNTHYALPITFRALTWTLITCIVALIIAGWFYLRNAFFYNGDFLALQVMRETAGQRQELPSLATLQAEFEGFRIAYWALFGGVNILADKWIYTILDWVSLLAVVGVIAFIGLRVKYQLTNQTDQSIASLGDGPRTTDHNPISWPTFLILLGWYAIMVTGFILWNLTQPAGQGRLLYPAIAAISALGLLGLTWWLPPLGQKIVAATCTLGLLLFATAAPFLYIAPTYAKPPMLTEQDLPADLQPINFTYDDTIRLLGYQLPIPTVHPAENLRLVLYWQLLKPAKLDYSIFVHVLGRQRRVVAQVDTYPGGGQWPTRLLAPGAILADHYAIPIPPSAETEHAPTRLLIAAGVYDFHQPGRPGKTARNAAGRPVEPIIAGAKLIPWQWPSLTPSEPVINFADLATLLSAQIAADQRSVTFNWQVQAKFPNDYTVFLQLWRNTATGPEYVTGFDGPPVQGDYPTSFWAPGEIIVDTHPLDLSAQPAGEYYLLAGLYNPASGDRLSAFAAGQPLPDYAINLGSLQVRGNQ
jgi:hypothetical protein